MKLPLSERPRERLVQYGAETLALTELLAILLTTGTKGKSVLELSQELLIRFGGLEGLTQASLAELMEVKGVGKAKAIQLKAALALSLRHRAAEHLAEKIGSQEAYGLVRDELIYQKHEVLISILKDVKGRLIARETVSVGTLSQVLVHPREVFYPAVRHKAASFILVHNHPSGDPSPSVADLELTRHLLRSSQVMGIGLDDHLIVGGGAFTSLRKLGYLG
jgi:DNA repair protein RadC